MNWSQWVSCLLSCAVAVAASALPACKRGPAWQVLGDSTRAKASESLPERSAFFDGERVSLRGARGETLGITVRSADGRARRVRLELPSNVAGVAGFEVRTLEVKEPSTDMYGKSLGKGRYPDVLVPRSGALAATEHAYFDVAVRHDAVPGSYAGTLWVDERQLDVDLKVSTAEIELERDPAVWVFYLPREVARVHGLADGDSAELVAKEAEYHQLFRAHGAFLAADLAPDRFPARRQFVHDVKYWPVAVDTSDDVSIARDTARWIELFRGTGVTPFAIPVDEPRTPEARARARHIAEVMRRAGAGRPALLTAVTDAWSPSYGDAFDLYFSPRNFPEFARARRPLGERYWTYNGKPPGAGSMILDTDGVALRTWGWIAQRYDIELWYAWEGLYFSDRYNRGGATDVLQDALTFDERRHGGSDYGNGDGVLAYPGPMPSLRLKALRRGLEDRLLLRELARCGGTEAARRITERMVPHALGDAGAKPSWSIEEPLWEHARLELLDAIERRCHEQAALAQ